LERLLLDTSVVVDVAVAGIIVLELHPVEAADGAIGGNVEEEVLLALATLKMSMTSPPAYWKAFAEFEDHGGSVSETGLPSWTWRFSVVWAVAKVVSSVTSTTVTRKRLDVPGRAPKLSWVR
jgi:hypothetical protein